MGDITLCIRLAKLYIIATLTPIKAVKAKSPSKKGPNAGYGIRTRELLRDRILSPAPLASLANPATI